MTGFSSHKEALVLCTSFAPALHQKAAAMTSNSGEAQAALLKGGRMTAMSARSALDWLGVAEWAEQMRCLDESFVPKEMELDQSRMDESNFQIEQEHMPPLPPVSLFTKKKREGRGKGKLGHPVCRVGGHG